MLKLKIPGGGSTFYAATTNATYHMGANATIDTATVGIDVSGLAIKRKIEIDGSIEAGTTAVMVGAAMQSAPRVDLSIGKGADLHGQATGIVSYSKDLVVRNAGEISGPSGIEVHGGINLVNTGEISGFYAINFYGESGAHVVRNAGTITGSVGGTDGQAIYGGGQIERVINTGTIDGDVNLGGGDDTFIFKSGTIDGVVRGGYGDDHFIVNKAGFEIVEDYDAGQDSVRSSVTFELQANVENLQLTGKKDIDAIGTGGNNTLTGNSGKNLLYGWYGEDALKGGAGNDILTGGAGGDEFHFQRGTGIDRVTDFEDGLDEIHLGDMKGAAGFNDMVDHHISIHGDDLWVTYGKDVIILKHTGSNDLHEADFIFAS